MEAYFFRQTYPAVITTTHIKSVMPMIRAYRISEKRKEAKSVSMHTADQGEILYYFGLRERKISVALRILH